jgi:hypothetical protein
MIMGNCFYVKYLALFFLNIMCVGQDSVVGIATHYRLDDPGDHIPLGGGIFCTLPDRPRGPPRFLYNGYWVFFWGVKWAGCGVHHPPPYSAKGIERVEPYLCSPSGPSWPV